MSKIVRKIQKLFGSSAGVNQIAKFGSLAAAAPAFTTDPAVIQSLSNYLTGWFGAVVGANSPAIEDMNALCYLFAYQLAYLMQTGTPEWEAGTTYYKGSLANNGGGLVYVSLTDSNLNNALTDATNWKAINGPSYDVVVGSAAYCTHATLAAAVADANVGTNVRVLLTEDYVVNSTIVLSKSGWRIEALPMVTYSKGTAATGISCTVDRVEIRNARFSGWSTAGNIAVSMASRWGRVMFCNFLNCDTDVDVSGGTPGALSITLGNITE